MDNPRITSPPSALGQNFTANHATQRSSRRTSSQITSKAPFKAASPKSIPNASIPPPPPPLPPPRHIEDIEAGDDPGWKWGNTGSMGRFGEIGSDVDSLHFSPRNWGKHIGGEVEMGPDPFEERRRESIASMHKYKSPTSKHFYDDRFQDEGYHSLSLGSNIAPQLVFSPLLDICTQYNLSGESIHIPCKRKPLHMCTESDINGWTYDHGLSSKIDLCKLTTGQISLGSKASDR